MCCVSREARDWLEDIQEACVLAVSWAVGQDLESFRADPILLTAVLHQIQIIGEAAKQLPEDVRALDPDIPWSTLARFRDVIVHNYFRIEPETVLQTAQERLPGLLIRVERLLDLLDSARA